MPSEADRLVELSAVLLATSDAELRLSFVNQAWERTLGWLPEELIGRHALELPHPEERDIVEAAFRTAHEGGGGAEAAFDCRVATRDGRWRWMSRTIRFDQGRFYGAGQDVEARRKVEQELRDSEASLEEAQAIAAMGSYELDLRAGTIRWTDELFRIYGFVPGELEPSPEAAIALTHPDDMAAVQSGFAGLAAGSIDEVALEYRIVRADGEERELYGNGRPVRDEARTVVGIFGTVQDVSERRRTERALAESEARLRALVEQVPAIVYTAKPGVDEAWDYVSPQIERLLGYAVDEWTSRTDLWTQVLHPDDLERITRMELESARPGQRFFAEYRVVSRWGDTVWLRDEAVTIEGADGRPRHQGVLLDITETKRAEAAVEDKHVQLQAIIDNSPLVIWAKDTELRYLFANREFQHRFGIDAATLAGRDDLELTSAEIAEPLRANDRRVLETGAPLEVEETLPVHGRERVFVAHKFPLRNARGEVYAVCGIATDITERKAREEELLARSEWSFRIRNAIELDRLVLHSQPIVEFELRTGRPGGAARAHAGRRRRADPAGRVPAGGRALQPRPGDRPLGDRAGRPLGPRPARGGEPLGPEHRRSAPDRVHRGRARGCRGRARQSHLRDHRDGRGLGPRARADARGAPDRARLRLRARRLRHRLRELHLPEAPSGGVHQDRHGVRARAHARIARPPGVSAIVDVARNFGIETVAEGVESGEVLELLGTLGVDYAQGYHLGRPAPT